MGGRSPGPSCPLPPPALVRTPQCVVCSLKVVLTVPPPPLCAARLPRGLLQPHGAQGCRAAPAGHCWYGGTPVGTSGWGWVVSPVGCLSLHPGRLPLPEVLGTIVPRSTRAVASAAPEPGLPCGPSSSAPALSRHALLDAAGIGSCARAAGDSREGSRVQPGSTEREAPGPAQWVPRGSGLATDCRRGWWARGAGLAGGEKQCPAPSAGAGQRWRRTAPGGKGPRPTWSKQHSSSSRDTGGC